MRLDGTDGMGWDRTGQKSAGHWTEWDDFLVVPRNSGLPSLMYEEFLSILHYLQIPVYVAEGEADPMIVNMAREYDAYIIADDSDYHLYKFDRGYVPLSYFSLDKLEGRLLSHG